MGTNGPNCRFYQNGKCFSLKRKPSRFLKRLPKCVKDKHRCAFNKCEFEEALPRPGGPRSVSGTATNKSLDEWITDLETKVLQLVEEGRSLLKGSKRD